MDTVRLSALASEIAEFDDAVSEDVPVKEWGGKVVRLKSLTAGQASEFAKKFAGKDPTSLDPTMYVLVRGLCDPETGDPLFPDGPQMVAMLVKKKVDVLARLALRIISLSGMGTNAVSAIETQEKNSNAITG